MGNVKLSVAMGPSDQPLPADNGSVVKAGGTGFQSIASGSIVGGSKNIDLEFIIGAHAGLHPDVKGVLLRVKEMEDTVHNVKHDQDDDHATLYVPVDEAWDRWEPAPPLADDPAHTSRWRKASYGPPSEFNGGNTARLYTKSLPWSTFAAMQGADHDNTPRGHTTRLLGHNGKHEVEIVEVKCVDTKTGSPTQGQTYYNSSALMWQSLPYGKPMVTNALGLPPVYKTTVQNLTIANVSTSAGSSDYIKFDPEGANGGSASPTISFDVNDLGTLGRYEWWIWLRATGENGWYTYATLNGKMSAPGRKTVTINAPQSPDTQDSDLTEWGTYAFDLRVVKLDENDVAGDYQDLRSSYITIPFNMPGVTGEDGLPVRGHSVDGWSTEQTDYKYYASYYLQSGRDASAMKVEFLDPLLRVKNTLTQPKTANTPHRDVLLYTPDTSSVENENIEETSHDEWRGIFVPTDDFKDQYRNHIDKAMLAVNAKKSAPKAQNFMGVTQQDLDNHIERLHWPAWFQQRVGYKPYASYSLDAQKFARSMKKSSVWFYAGEGHGNHDLTDETNGGSIWAEIDFNNPNVRLDAQRDSSSNVSQVYVKDFPAGSLNGTQLVIYDGCYTGKTSSLRGNLVRQTAYKGARGVAGYTGLVPGELQDLYIFYLWEALCLGERSTGGYNPFAEYHTPFTIEQVSQLIRNPNGYNTTGLIKSPLGLTSAMRYAANMVKANYPSRGAMWDGFLAYSHSSSGAGTENTEKHAAAYKSNRYSPSPLGY